LELSEREKPGKVGRDPGMGSGRSEMAVWDPKELLQWMVFLE
jgi:hypothetical protein